MCGKVIEATFAVSLLLLVAAFYFAGGSNSFAETTNFQVNVVDSMTVQVSTPHDGASGEYNEFLRNKVTVSVTSNDSSGFTATMYAQGSTDLTNTVRTSVTLATLSSSSTRGNFPAGRWGYSLKSSSLAGRTYGETDAGNTNSYYYPLVSNSASPITILTAASGTYSGSQDIYFGARGAMDKAAGTYTGTVLISVVTGTINENTNPATPTNPSRDTDAPGPGIAGYNSTTDRTVYYTTSSSTATTDVVTTEITSGDVRSEYFAPQGVTKSTTTNVVSDSSLAAGLATTASIAAAGGIFFFILAKRREEDDDEEENQQM